MSITLNFVAKARWKIDCVIIKIQSLTKIIVALKQKEVLNLISPILFVINEIIYNWLILVRSKLQISIKDSNVRP